MSRSPTDRSSWTRRAGFILAAVGSAVGLGNVWRFPFQAGQEGGAVFVLLYLCFVLLIGVPAMLVEFTVGRRTGRGPVGALAEFGGGAWRYLGGLFILIGFLILSYYSVVAGWVLRYVVGSVTGGYAGQSETYFLDIATGFDALAFHAIFMALTVAIVALGVRRGIELAVTVMVPAVVFVVLALVVYAWTLPDAGVAYEYYLSPDFSLLASDWRSIVPAAAGQAFFSLSIGMGVMITFASYLDEERNLLVDTGIIVAIDTAVAFLTGLFVFPILFTAGVGPADPGPGAIFVALAGAFADIPAGSVVGVVFFGMFAIAALSSAISIMEVVVSFGIDEFGAVRRRTAAVTGVAMFLLGTPVALLSSQRQPIFVTLYDTLAAQILLVSGGIVLMILVAWIGADRAMAELRRGIHSPGILPRVWIWLVRIPVIVVLLVTLALAVGDYWSFLTGDFADFLGL
ncbi:SNF family Na+-dependent transporter [Halovivax ruber XH-70]|uniref:SNF family Na+-dependent transporter n=1 Tax=Halovivax ruber (strain DSM 18193 / JCM 13892 / XH-70) TaxID=797302 RepID=L0IA41_HALRX|nr:sodium-dependent transporter [Halovivax ruber]AGB16460.1 SNF family Na+-dependent transporter [Halovivax ruber XH-70]